jgi:hypothetical protein
VDIEVYTNECKGKTMTIVTEDGEERNLQQKDRDEFGLVWVTFWLGRLFFGRVPLFSRTAVYNHFSPSNDDLMHRL